MVCTGCISSSSSVLRIGAVSAHTCTINRSLAEVYELSECVLVASGSWARRPVFIVQPNRIIADWQKTKKNTREQWLITDCWCFFFSFLSARRCSVHDSSSRCCFCVIDGLFHIFIERTQIDFSALRCVLSAVQDKVKKESNIYFKLSTILVFNRISVYNKLIFWVVFLLICLLYFL